MRETDTINNNEESLLNDFQKKAIEEGLEDIEKGRVHSHQEVMDETKKRFSHLFNRI